MYVTAVNQKPLTFLFKIQKRRIDFYKQNKELQEVYEFDWPGQKII